MSNLATVNQSAIESALIMGDLSKLNPDQRLSYYKSVCDSVGLNPLTKPFDYIQLNGKLTLYAKRDATDQLRKVHGVSIKITSREKFDDIYVVTAQGLDKSGRYDESTGAVNVAGLKGEALANAYLKAETKAKRRVTLSLCGLGLLDESEVQTIPDAKPFEESSQAQKNVEQIAEVLRETGFDSKSVKEEQSKFDVNKYVIKSGKYKTKTFPEVDFHDLCGYLDQLKSAIENGIDGQPMKPAALKSTKELEEMGRLYVSQFTKKKSEEPILDLEEELI